MGILISVDPGKDNMAFSVFTDKGKLLKFGMLKNTISDIKDNKKTSIIVKKMITEISNIYDTSKKVRLVFERFVPRSMQKGNLAELSNIHIGILLSSINYSEFDCIMASSWKNFLNRNNLILNNDSAPPHVFDSFGIGLYYLIKVKKLSINDVYKIINKINKTNYNYYRYNGLWFKGPRIVEHKRGKKNSFGV